MVQLRACQKSAQSVTEVVAQIDETGFRVSKQRWWLHVACTRWLTLYLAYRKRGDEALKAMGSARISGNQCA
jgi:hypothetical protein